MAVRSAALVRPPPSAALAVAVRAGGGAPESDFGSAARWATVLAWAATAILSALIGAAHQGGPRAWTRRIRLPLRALTVVGVAVALGVAGRERVGALAVLAVLAAVGLGCSLVEQLAVAADRVGLFRRENGEEGQYVGEPRGVEAKHRAARRRESHAPSDV